MSCTYQSVTLQTGDSFVLPPGATLISATDPNLLTSENGCADKDLANLATVECYKSTFADVDQLGGHTPAYIIVTIVGISINGSLYPFTTPFTFNETWTIPPFVTGLTTAINTTSIGPLITGLTVTSMYQQNGEYFAFTFNTISTIGDNMVFYGIADGGNTGGASFPIQYPALKCEIV